MSGGQRDVLEPHLTACDLLAVLGAGDYDLPELLDLALYDGLCEHVDPPLRHRPQKVGVIVDAHGKLPVLLDRRRRPHTGRRLHGRRVDAAMHHPPRRMMLLSQLDRPPDPAPASLLEAQPGDPHELAAPRADRGLTGVSRHGLLLYAITFERSQTMEIARATPLVAHLSLLASPQHTFN